jgi:alkanesulfonate monooxygenase SsuD/methylene tetrahydromethanopterin reductase-like flavin-dependent oxidoreductase (luciferase family)
VADILSGGRVIFGVARGYHTREVESFGAPLITGRMPDPERFIFSDVPASCSIDRE